MVQSMQFYSFAKNICESSRSICFLRFEICQCCAIVCRHPATCENMKATEGCTHKNSNAVIWDWPARRSSWLAWRWKGNGGVRSPCVTFAVVQEGSLIRTLKPCKTQYATWCDDMHNNVGKASDSSWCIQHDVYQSTSCQGWSIVVSKSASELPTWIELDLSTVFAVMKLLSAVFFAVVQCWSRLQPTKLLQHATLNLLFWHDMTTFRYK